MRRKTYLLAAVAGVCGGAFLAGCSTTNTSKHVYSPTPTPTFTATAVPTPTGTPNLSTSNKSVQPVGTVLPGTILHYYINIVNSGASAAAGVTVVDPLPSQLDPATVVFLAGPSGTVSGQTITWNVGLVPVGTLTLHFSVQLIATTAPGTVFSNTAIVSGSNVGNTNVGPTANSAGLLSPTRTATATPTTTYTFSPTATPTNTITLTHTITPTTTVGASLAGSGKTGPPSGLVRNAAAHFYITITSSGGAGATSVTVTDVLDPYLDPATTVFWSGPSGSVSGNTITWNLGTLAAGSSTTLHFSVNVLASAPIGQAICNSAGITAANAGAVGVGPACFQVIPNSPTFSMTSTSTRTSTQTFTSTPTSTRTLTNSPTAPAGSTSTPTAACTMMASQNSIISAVAPAYYCGTVNNVWWAVMGTTWATGGADYDMAGYQTCGGALFGTSAVTVGGVDYVSWNGNTLGTICAQGQVILSAGAGTYEVDFDSNGSAIIGNGSYGPYNYTSANLVRTWDTNLTSGTPYTFTFTAPASYGFRLHSPGNGSYQLRSQAVANAPGGSSFNYTPTTTGWHQLVWVNDGFVSGAVTIQRAP